MKTKKKTKQPTVCEAWCGQCKQCERYYLSLPCGCGRRDCSECSPPRRMTNEEKRYYFGVPDDWVRDDDERDIG